MSEFDAIDSQIIDLLRTDGRASFTFIGEAVGLSSTAVKRRVDQLVECGIIEGFTVQTSRNLDADYIHAFLEVFCHGTVSPERLLTTLDDIHEVKWACTITGKADALVLVVAPTVAALEVAIERVREAEHVHNTITSIRLTQILDRA
ncbi:Lrp/AsnC family transcriptional regulator [Rarobacter faecitabidus]|uniref:AsnC family transcriptional regulator n=1 Tax=Rarobacter faecitabidus TaxID=13243 RepID=A0A542ZDR3_RARFA|nr:Lrp/AsnC family transcriptional regulator [Rarobacter faecitabidus]TQL58494.1 AsnC family transcriptional regulator [Rarobacter faecitabidus]